MVELIEYKDGSFYRERYTLNRKGTVSVEYFTDQKMSDLSYCIHEGVFKDCRRCTYYGDLTCAKDSTTITVAELAQKMGISEKGAYFLLISGEDYSFMKEKRQYHLICF